MNERYRSEFLQHEHERQFGNKRFDNPGNRYNRQNYKNCFNCGKNGHIARNCFQRNSSEPISLPDMFQKLNQKLDTIVERSQNEFGKINYRISKVSDELKHVSKNVKDNSDEIKLVSKQNDKEFKKLDRKIQAIYSSFKNGLGRSFEKFNMAWLQRELAINHPHATLHNAKRFVDTDKIVNPKTAEFELDIYCENPLLVAECTTFLMSNEFDKVNKLLRVRNFFKKYDKNSDCILYFITYDIDDDIKNDVDVFCQNNDIKLVYNV